MRTGTKILLGVTLIMLLLIAGRLFLSESSFSPANPSWDGSSFAMAGNVRPLYGFDRLQGGNGSTLLIVGPSIDYSPLDADYVLLFLQQGGRVVLMDDFGTANSLLRNLSAPVTILHTLVCQDLDYYKKPAFPIVRNVGDSSLTANVSTLIFNHPAPLEVSNDTEVLARTTIMGWLDPNDNAAMDKDEKFASYPLVARVAYGSGELFVAGDADLATNVMQDQGDDGTMMSDVMSSGTVYLDVGHGQQVPPLAWLYYAMKYNTIAQLLFTLLVFALGLAYVTRNRFLRYHEPEEPAPDGKGPLIAAMKERLPVSRRELDEINKKLQGE